MDSLYTLHICWVPNTLVAKCANLHLSPNQRPNTPLQPFEPTHFNSFQPTCGSQSLPQVKNPKVTTPSFPPPPTQSPPSHNPRTTRATSSARPARPKLCATPARSSSSLLLQAKPRVAEGDRWLQDFHARNILARWYTLFLIS